LRASCVFQHGETVTTPTRRPPACDVDASRFSVMPKARHYDAALPADHEGHLLAILDRQRSSAASVQRRQHRAERCALGPIDFLLPVLVRRRRSPRETPPLIGGGSRPSDPARDPRDRRAPAVPSERKRHANARRPRRAIARVPTPLWNPGLLRARFADRQSSRGARLHLRTSMGARIRAPGASHHGGAGLHTRIRAPHERARAHLERGAASGRWSTVARRNPSARIRCTAPYRSPSGIGEGAPDL
jgi:hypothetical protein